MHKVKSNGTIKQLLENTDITQGTFSWKDTHNNLKLVTGKWAPGQDRMNQPGRARFLEPTLFPGALLGILDIISCDCKHQALDPWHRSEIFMKR